MVVQLQDGERGVLFPSPSGSRRSDRQTLLHLVKKFFPRGGWDDKVEFPRERQELEESWPPSLSDRESDKLACSRAMSNLDAMTSYEPNRHDISPLSHVVE
jgi:hypothetical protein